MYNCTVGWSEEKYTSDFYQIHGVVHFEIEMHKKNFWAPSSKADETGGAQSGITFLQTDILVHRCLFKIH